MISLETDRLRIRNVEEGDLDFLCEILATKRGVPDFPFVYSREEVAAKIAKAIAGRSRPGGMGLAERKADGVPVGRYGVLKTEVRP